MKTRLKFVMSTPALGTPIRVPVCNGSTKQTDHVYLVADDI